MAHQKIRFTKSAESSSSQTNGINEAIFVNYPNYEMLFEFAKENCKSDQDDDKNHLKLTKAKPWDSLKVPERTQSMRQPKTSPRSASMQRTYTTKVSGSSSSRTTNESKEKLSLQRSFKGSSNSKMSQANEISATTPTDDDITRLRTFIIDPKAGLINRGDSFRSRNLNFMSSSESVLCLNGSRSSSVASSRSHSPFPPELTMVPPTQPCNGIIARYEVLVIGSEGVGKSVLINQFKTSEYCNLFSNESVDFPDDEQRTSVSVVLDAEESELVFIECDNEKDNIWKEKDCSGYLIVYSVDKEVSFKNAVRVLKELCNIIKNKGIWKPIVLVGNKVDLERRRYVNKEGAKHVAEQHGCKFVEISVAIGHNVDKLLAGILSQIRQKPDGFSSDSEEVKTKKREKLKLSASRSHTTSNVTGLAAAKKQLISKLSFKHSKTSKSVEDLFSVHKN